MMDRPGFVTGVALVANAVAREIFKVDASPEAIEAVQAVVEQHDSKGWWGQIVGADASGPGFDLSWCESSGNDWVDGYQEALTALAAAIEAVPLEPNSIAVVGMLLDRREADRRADYDELAGYLAALGLDFCGFFPAFDVVDSSQLKDIAPASTIISLPYGRKAAHAISKKTGAKLIELDLPIGFAGTSDWISEVALACGRQQAAEQLIKSKLGSAVPKLEWVVPFWLLHRRILLVGDVYKVKGWAEALHEFGCNVLGAICTGGNPASAPDINWIDNIPDDLEVDLVIGSPVAEAKVLPFLEMGFPNFGEHFIYSRPELGFAGTLATVEAIINRLALTSVMRHWPGGRVKFDLRKDP
ncbi:MAG TPA: nitrogenase component 1 [Myxococcota bacterium]|jgi:nitrogenase molybdenum-iron protein alpha/beta subunit|nr:nitrogenase component 1 [Myxococcota bacterium]HON26324.1 nitrogenase component 1 [Myxococcota bacterium]HOS61600.1 nitrogenase component 1 [Myxococcota bacterium]HPC91507.1 nitrogenase component 1 [Myxococcota bacterium]HQE73135.1 nitrogenase component 1 [Myxococcota bacterium]